MSTTKLSGKTCLVTGATNGIGKASAMALARMGAEVVLLGRNAEKGARIIEELRKECGHDRLDFLCCDLSSLSDVRRAAREFLASGRPLHILLNNAGIFNRERLLSKDGFEETWAVNHLAPMLFTNLLLDRLKESAPARIVNVSSMAYAFTKGMQWDDLQFEKAKYKLFPVYAQSKLANILFTHELSRQLEGSRVTVNALHPGGVSTGIGQQDASFLLGLIGKFIMLFMKSPEQGAKTSVYLCSSPEVEGNSGLFWEKCKPKKLKPFASNSDDARRLWEISVSQIESVEN